jgi:hypothetical protein
MVGLVGGLLSMTPMVLAKDRDYTPRGKAAYGTFVKTDFPGAPSTAALVLIQPAKLSGASRPLATLPEPAAFCETGLTSSPLTALSFLLHLA